MNIAPKVYSAQAIYDNVNLEKKTVKASSALSATDSNYVKFQINETTKEIIETKEKMKNILSVLDNTNKKFKELNINLNKSYQDLEEVADNKQILNGRLQDQDRNLGQIVEQMDIYKENEVNGRNFLIYFFIMKGSFLLFFTSSICTISSSRERG